LLVVEAPGDIRSLSYLARLTADDADLFDWFFVIFRVIRVIRVFRGSVFNTRITRNGTENPKEIRSIRVVCG
jgi:hypothetical protein